MALTIVVLAGTEALSGEELSLSLDAPRVVIGRGEGCEIRLPDPSVSHRHASIRQRGAEYVVLDEDSENGTFVGKTRLAPKTPTPLRSGDRIRVGRVWLAIRVEPVVVRGAVAARAKELALALVARGLVAQGEDPSPRIVVIDGPDRGRTLRLDHAGRPYVIGRARDADLPINDPDVSRRHVVVIRRGDQFSVQDLASRAGAKLDGAPLAQFDTPWKPGQVLTICRNRLVCEHPAAEALAELERSPCELLQPGEVPDLPEPDPPAATEVPTPSPVSTTAAEEPLVARPSTASSLPLPAPEPSGSWSFTDAAVVVLALGVLALSIAGLVWLLGRG